MDPHSSSPCGPDLHRDSARCSHSTHGHRAQVDHSRIRAGSRGRHQARLRRLAAGVVGPAAARVFRFRSPETGSKRAGCRRSGAVPGSCGRSAIRVAALATEKSANENRHRDDVWRPLRDRWFESCSLQRRSSCELAPRGFGVERAIGRSIGRVYDATRPGSVLPARVGSVNVGVRKILNGMK